ncbi:hypothetical protein [Thalassotalea atypica]|uniref:hypothetical protein n=1 Tax=Thalassotalea atypica TaxID=2054316 RepID=UPI002572A35D|nr:hypothetical protein [Thalassotalea atypica]
MEIIAGIAVAIILWMLWQVYRARQFNNFKARINSELKSLVIKELQHRLERQRSETFPNNDTHIRASIYYWSQYPSRVLQAAIAWGVVTEDWLEKTGNTRHCQHLFFIERDKLAHFAKEPDIESEQP